MQKILSLIIPSYNMEALLPKCLESLCVKDKALFERLEVLVVNDGSTDGTSAVAHRYAEQSPGVFKVIDKPNGHYGSCINAALPVATGTFVKILDADDWFDTEGLEAFLLELSRLEDDAEVDVVFTQYDVVDRAGNVMSEPRCALPLAMPFDLSMLSAVDVEQTWMHALAYRRSMVLEMGYRQTEGMPFTDQEWVFAPMSRVRKAYYVPIVVYKYWVGREGQTVEEGYYLDHFYHVRQLTLAQVEAFEGLSRNATEGGRHFLKARLLSRVLRVYKFHLMVAVKRLRKEREALVAFDATLKRCVPACYAQSEAARLIRRVPIRVVHAWRLQQAGRPFQMWVLQWVILPLSKLKEAVKGWLGRGTRQSST